MRFVHFWSDVQVTKNGPTERASRDLWFLKVCEPTHFRSGSVGHADRTSVHVEYSINIDICKEVSIYKAGIR